MSPSGHKLKKTGPEGPASLTGRCQRCAWEARGRAHASDPNIHAHVVPVGSDPGHILRLKFPRAAVVGDPLGMSASGQKRLSVAGLLKVAAILRALDPPLEMRLVRFQLEHDSQGLGAYGVGVPSRVGRDFLERHPQLLAALA